jgi:hypothetical protein
MATSNEHTILKIFIVDADNVQKLLIKDTNIINAVKISPRTDGIQKMENIIPQTGGDQGFFGGSVLFLLKLKDKALNKLIDDVSNIITIDSYHLDVNTEKLQELTEKLKDARDHKILGILYDSMHTVLNQLRDIKQNLSNPFDSVETITGVQQTLQAIIKVADQWPLQISNGTILMVEKFYDSNIDSIPESPSSYQTYIYKLLHSPDFSLIKYSVSHFFDLIKGLYNIHKLLSNEDLFQLKVKVQVEI